MKSYNRSDPGFLGEPLGWRMFRDVPLSVFGETDPLRSTRKGGSEVSNIGRRDVSPLREEKSYKGVKRVV